MKTSAMKASIKISFKREKINPEDLSEPTPIITCEDEAAAMRRSIEKLLEILTSRKTNTGERGEK